MKFKITSIGTLKGTDYLYLDVEFLEGGRVVHRSDFIMQVHPTWREYTGEVDEDGEYVDPEAFITRQTDVPAVVQKRIRRYVQRTDFASVPRDRRDPGIQSDDTDPLGLVDRAKDLIGQEIDCDHA